MTDAALVIADALTRLSIARGGQPDDYTGSVYLERLERFDAEHVARACAELSDEPRGDYESVLPSVGQIIDRVKRFERLDQENAAKQKLLPSPARNEQEPTFFCRDCWDEPNAWRLFWCNGRGEFSAGKPAQTPAMSTHPCARQQPHTGHVYTEKCGCSDINPVIAKHRERMMAARPKSQPRRGEDRG